MFSLFGLFNLYNNDLRAFWILEKELGDEAWDLIMPFLDVFKPKTNTISALIKVFSSKGITLDPKQNKIEEDHFHPFEETGDIDEELMKVFEWRPHNNFQSFDLGDPMYKLHIL